MSLCLGGENRFRFIDHCSLIFKRNADAYGNTLIFTAPGPDGLWFTDDDVQSNYGANEIIFCGYRNDPETQNYYVRNRACNPVLGRWLQRDPIGYSGGINLYEYVESAPVGNVDARGEAVSGIDGGTPVQRAAIRIADASVSARLPVVLKDVKRFNTVYFDQLMINTPGIFNYGQLQTIYNQYYVSILATISQMNSAEKAGVSVAVECHCKRGETGYVNFFLSVRYGPIHLCPPFFRLSLADRAAAYMHELSHWAADTDDLALSWFPADLPAAADDAHYVMKFMNGSVRSVTSKWIWFPLLHHGK